MEPKRRCANCGIRIHWQATLVNDKAYCCPGCAEGGPCLCDYDNLPQADEARPIVHQRASGSLEQLPIGAESGDEG